MRISSVFPSNYLSATDLDGRPMILTMANVAMQDVGMGAEKKVLPVLYFEGKAKGLILNKTNSRKIVEMFGDDTDNWVGEQITLFEATVEFQGSAVQAIRVRQAPRKSSNSDKQSPAPQTSASLTLKETLEEIIDGDIPF